MVTVRRRHLGFYFFLLQFLSKKSILRLFLSPHAKFGEDRTTRGWVIAYFRFQNGGRPPSWISYDVIADHPRPVFDGPNIVLKLHVDRIHTLQDIAIFIFGPFGLKLCCLFTPLLQSFGGYYPHMNSDIVATPKRTVLGWKLNTSSYEP